MKRLLLALLLGAGMVAGHTFAAPASGSAIVAELQKVSGILAVQYGDSAPGSGMPSRRLVSLHADTGEVYLLEAEEGADFLPKGVHAYQGKRVTVTGRVKSGSDLAKFASGPRRFAISGEVQVHASGASDLASQKYADPTPVARPFVSLLCKFADDPSEPQPIGYFVTMHSNTYPGFDHYMREASYGKTTLVGSNAFGWFTLPQPRSFYVPNNPTNEQSQQMLTNLADACSTVAKATVNFTPFFGINFMFNGPLDSAAWGGTSVLNLTADGTKSWPSTWMPYTGSGPERFGWNTHNIMAHELSHAFGAPHSQTPEGNEYGSSWDVVSAPGDNCTAAFTDAAYGCIGQSMNGYAKTTMDFLPDNRLVTHSLASGSRTYQLEELAQAPANTNPLVVRIPVAGSTTRLYTVEARRRQGYDQKLRTDGVIIHEIDTTRDRPAQVVPMDPANPGGAGGAWTVGKTFLNSSDNVLIQVVAATATGFSVNVGPAPAGTSSLGVSRTGSGAGSVTSSPAGIDCGTTCTAGFSTGTVVTLTAAASAGSTFHGWSGICSGTSTCTVTLDAAKRVTATFSASDVVSSNLAVYLAGTGTGTVTSNPFGINCGPVCSWDSVPGSASVTLVATPATGSTFAGWSGACTGTGNCVVTAATSRSITATFTGSSGSASNHTALWWNPAEAGWGVNFNHQGTTLFGTLFTYEASRAPMWLVMSAGAQQADGSFQGDLFQTTGPAFNANPFTPIGAANVTKVGTMSATFSSADAGVLTYTVNGVQVRKDIQRQVYDTRAATCTPTTGSRASATNYQDLWWNAAESGWGVNLTHQNNTIFATLFTYDATGKGLWLVMSAGTRQADGSYLGDLFQTSGPAFNTQPFTGVGVATVGTMRLRFTDGEHGTLTYTYNGIAVTKAITRQTFSTPVPLCAS
jgi:M6 family metalloprotease-like protein